MKYKQIEEFKLEMSETEIEEGNIKNLAENECQVKNLNFCSHEIENFKVLKTYSKCSNTTYDESINSFKNINTPISSVSSNLNRDSNRDVNNPIKPSKTADSASITPTTHLNTSNFAKNTEENLRNEIESILLNVYLERINRTNNVDFSVFEKHILFCSESFNKKFNLHILQILTQKISLVVERIKDRIYKINDITLLQEKFYQLRSFYQIHELEENNSNNSNSNSNSKVSNATATETSLDEKIKEVMKEMLEELREIIYSVLEASIDAAKIFKPIIHIVLKDANYFNFEEIHREELANTVMNDEFLKIIFFQIKGNSSNESYEELFDIVTEIEEILVDNQKEMTKIKTLIEMVRQKANVLDLSVNTTNNVSTLHTANNSCSTCSNCMIKNLQKKGSHGHSHSHSHGSSHNHKHTYAGVTNRNSKRHQNQIQISELANEIRSPGKSYIKVKDLKEKDKEKRKETEKEKEKEKEKANFKDIDDLLDYINADVDELKPKKKSKKKNKKEKKIPIISNINIIKRPSVDIKENEKTEKEIEEFKMNIKNNSINAYSIRKIKPKISPQFVMNCVRE